MSLCVVISSMHMRVGEDCTVCVCVCVCVYVCACMHRCGVCGLNSVSVVDCTVCTRVCLLD